MAYVKAGGTIYNAPEPNAFGRALLKRFVASSELPPGTVADFDTVKNLLRIDKEFYDNADERTKAKLWRTKANIVVN